MAYLPQETLSLTGGCFCKSIRYTIRVPAHDDRMIVPEAAETRLKTSDGKTRRIPTKFPIVDFDHCGDCRHASGANALAWIICPLDWVEWGLSVASAEVSSRVVVPSLEVCKASKTVAAGGRKEGSSDWVTENLPGTSLAQFCSSPDVTRTFCSKCGTTLTFFYDRPESSPMPGVCDITLGSLDDESIAITRPERHSWWKSNVSWFGQMVKNGDGGLMTHETGDIRYVKEDGRE
ncbi:hypothetical protein FQN57_002566 [Myotisia sp. PD_48]|nr:hypothetical protein FQN57_002566 [Myotisia sp. PD_48]